MASSAITLTILKDLVLVQTVMETRTDLNVWDVFAINGTTSGGGALNPQGLVPGLATYPALILGNPVTAAKGGVAVNLSFKAFNAGSVITITIPPGSFTYLPQVDYASGIIGLTTGSGIAACIAILGTSQ